MNVTIFFTHVRNCVMEATPMIRSNPKQYAHALMNIATAVMHAHSPLLHCMSCQHGVQYLIRQVAKSALILPFAVLVIA